MSSLLRSTGALFSFLVLLLPARAQIINTIAGNGTQGYSGDGGTATSAQLSGPYGVALDGAGNVYFSDYGNDRIRKIAAATGLISTVAGSAGSALGDGGAATSANLLFPQGIAVDGSGNIYIADVGNNRVRKVTAATGIITTIAGSSTAGFSGDGGAATSAKIYSPSSVVLDGSGNVYFVDNVNLRVRKVTVATGIISTIAGTGTSGFSGDNGPATSAQMGPNGVAVDGAGNVYISDYDNNRIRKVAAGTGIITTIAGTGTAGFGGDGGPATSAQLNGPNGLTVDGAGNIFFADYDNSRIRKINSATGIITTIAGTNTSGFSGDGGAATSAQLQRPTDVALDAQGNVYITDQYNGRVRKITYSNTAVPAGATGLAGNFSIAPSPCNGRFTITATQDASHSGERVHITLINSIGQIVYSSEAAPAGAQWSIPVQVGAGEANGLYQLRISVGMVSAVRSLVIER